MNMVTMINHHLVKNEDLNHHGTLYAGRTADWLSNRALLQPPA